MAEPFSSCATVTDTAVYGYGKVMWVVQSVIINHQATDVYMTLPTPLTQTVSCTNMNKNI